MRPLLALSLLLALPAVGQTLYIYPATVSSVVGGTQTITAVVNGVNNKTVHWTTTGGTLVGSANCTVNEACTIGLTTTTPGTYTVTAISNANGAVTGTSTVTFTAAPTPIQCSSGAPDTTACHPRLIITTAMLPALQARATGSNTRFVALKNAAIAAFNRDTTPGSGPNWSWHCTGGSGLPQNAGTWTGQEANAWLFALMALLDPSDPTYNWGCYGRDEWVYTANLVTTGAYPIAGNPFSDSSLFFTLTTDWLMGSGSLSPSDVTACRQFLAFLGKDVLSFTGNGYTPIICNSPGSTVACNSPQLYIPASSPAGDVGTLRIMGNNYTFSKVFYMAAVALTFDDNTTDDPPLSNTCSATRYQVCTDYSAGSLHGYGSYLERAMLYLEYSHLEDPTVSQPVLNTAYGNLPSAPTCLLTGGASYPCLGDSRDGASAEGSWYSYSQYRLRYALNMLHSAGYANPDAPCIGETTSATTCPQLALDTSSWWDLKYITDLEELTTQSGKNGPVNGGQVSPAYGYILNGDANTYFRIPLDMYTEGGLLTADTYTGRTDRTSALEWIVLNSAFGGPDGTQGGCTLYCGFNSTNLAAVQGYYGYIALDTFIALTANDPTISPPSDPRPSLPTDFYDASWNNGQILRNSWASNYTMMDTNCENSYIDHEYSNCGRYEVFSNSEWITKARDVFTDYITYYSTALSGNQASYTNTYSGTNPCNGNIICNDRIPPYGGQFWHGQQAGFATPIHSEMPTYAATSVDDTGDYNGWWSFNTPFDTPSYADVSGASRDTIWLRSANQVVTYDRVATGNATAKLINLNTTGVTTTVGNTVNWLTQSGTQKANFTTLLPASATLTTSKLANSSATSAPFGNLQNTTTMQMTCTANNTDGTTTNITSTTASWTSSNTSVATISSTGLVTAVGLGTTTIACYDPVFQAAYSYGTLTVISGASSGSWVNTTWNTNAADWEVRNVIQVGPASPTTAMNALNTLEWGASAYTPTVTALVQSSAGQGYDCAKMGTASQACFIRSLASFTGTTIPVSGALTMYVANLAPNTSYSASGAGVPASVTSDNAGVAVLTTTGAGSVVLSSGGPPPVSPPILQGVTLQGASVQ